MPMRVGFAQHRAKQLQEELDSIVAALPQLGVRRAILLNPLYPGSVEPDTALKLVMIMDDDRPFVRRPDFFYSHLSPTVAVDFFPYTPDEFDELGAQDNALARALQMGEVVYDA